MVRCRDVISRNSAQCRFWKGILALNCIDVCASPLHFRNAFLAVSFNYASYRKCFHNSNSRASWWHSAVAGTEGLAASSSPPWSVVSVFTVCQVGWSKGVFPLRFLCFEPLPGLFYNKSIICFNKLSVNTCEKNDFLKAFDALQG